MSTRTHLAASDVGSRVVVRYRLPGEVGPTGGPLATDVIGWLLDWSTNEVSVEDKTGARVRIAQEAIVAAKPVPPPYRRHVTGGRGG